MPMLGYHGLSKYLLSRYGRAWQGYTPANQWTKDDYSLNQYHSEFPMGGMGLDLSQALLLVVPADVSSFALSYPS